MLTLYILVRVRTLYGVVTIRPLRPLGQPSHAPLPIQPEDGVMMDENSQKPGRFQFRLRTLFLLTTVVAVVLFVGQRFYVAGQQSILDRIEAEDAARERQDPPRANFGQGPALYPETFPAVEASQVP